MIHLVIPKSPENNLQIHALKYNDGDRKTFLFHLVTLKQFNSLQKIKVPALHQLTMRLTVWVNDCH